MMIQDQGCTVGTILGVLSLHHVTGPVHHIEAVQMMHRLGTQNLHVSILRSMTSVNTSQ